MYSLHRMTANFGENIMSKNILINFGNTNEKVVEIGSINISLGETVLEISSNEIDKYFILNKYISQSDSNVLKTKRIDGKLNPILTSKNKLLNYFKKPIK